MKRAAHLITQVRRQTENVLTGITDGITDEEFLQYLNDGQDEIYNAIRQTHSREFAKEGFIDTVRGQDLYDFPFDIMHNTSVIAMYYAYTGNTASYSKLTKGYLSERTTVLARPRRYIPSGDKTFYLDPIPSESRTNGIRLHYNRKLREIDKRRGTVSAVTVVAGDITALTIGGSEFNESDWTQDDYLCAVDAQGNIKTRGIQYDAVSAGGVVTLTGSSHTLDTGESIAIGDYVVRGKYASPTSELVDDCERFLLAYAALEIFKRDSSTDSLQQQQNVDRMRSDLVSIFSDPNDDVNEVPITDWTYDPEEY